MLITRRSTWSDITRTRDLPVTEEQMAMFKKGELVQVAFPQLSASDREFILTGMTDDEFNQMVDRALAEGGERAAAEFADTRLGEGARE